MNSQNVEETAILQDKRQEIRHKLRQEQQHRTPERFNCIKVCDKKKD